MLNAVGYLSFVFNNLIFVTEEFIRALVIQGSLLTYFLLIVLVLKEYSVKTMFINVNKLVIRTICIMVRHNGGKF